MGALAGGAAGGFAGHQAGHGIIGGLGGAVAGSMLEDAAKKHGKKGKKDKGKAGKQERRQNRGGRRGSSSSSSSSSSGSDRKKRHGKGTHQPVPAGNFRASSRDARLEGRATLVAECADVKGFYRRAALNLNECLTNTNGTLRWAKRGNFAASARQIRLVEGGNVLVCELGNGKGGWVSNRMVLNERITNDDGKLVVL